MNSAPAADHPHPIPARSTLRIAHSAAPPALPISPRNPLRLIRIIGTGLTLHQASGENRRERALVVSTLQWK